MAQFINSVVTIALTHVDATSHHKPLLVHKSPIPLRLVEPVRKHNREVPPRLEFIHNVGGCPSELSLRISERLATGRCSVVFAVETQGIDMNIPPMVIKVARKSYTKFIAREAWFYDELACLQGSVIPRCFGYFSVKLSDDIALEWDETRPNPDFDLDYPQNRITGSSVRSLSQQTQMDYGIRGLRLSESSMLNYWETYASQITFLSFC